MSDGTYVTRSGKVGRPWTPQEHEAMREAVMEGKVSASIAANMLNERFHGGRPVRNRSMVIGRLYRCAHLRSEGVRRPGFEISNRSLDKVRAVPDRRGRVRDHKAEYARRVEREAMNPVKRVPAPQVERSYPVVRAKAREPERVMGANGKYGGIDVRKFMPDVLEGGVPFLEAAWGQCRFPLRGTGMNMVVCGDPVAPKSSYCESCRGIASAPYVRKAPAPHFVKA